MGCVCMIDEREVQSQLMSYCLSMSWSQFTNSLSLKNNSTVWCLHSYWWLVWCNERRRIGYVLFHGCAKLFDCINHDLLLKKVSLYGIYSTKRKWFQIISQTNTSLFMSIHGVPALYSLCLLKISLSTLTILISMSLSMAVLSDNKTRAPSQYKDRLIYVWRFPC